MIFVFIGPTIAPHEAAMELNARFLPPVAQGDVYRAALRQPKAIGIIDGYFDRMPAVWHKEILWALAQGIRVFGSASMGALRAAELTVFGMEGVGQIFEAFRDGTLEDDDEVAVIHGPPESGYVCASEAMINIRTTLQQACLERIISPTTRETLTNFAKGLLYPDRSYEAIIEHAKSVGVPEPEVQALRTWLPQGRVDQKRQDALAMLRRMRECLDSEPPPQTVSFSFAHTQAWDRLQQSAGELNIPGEDHEAGVLVDAILDEYRLERLDVGIAPALDAALAKYLANVLAQRERFIPDAESLKDTILAFRRRHQLFESWELDRWLEKQRLDRDHFLGLMQEVTRLQWVRSRAEGDLVGTLFDDLRLTGEYARLRDRADKKERMLATHGLEEPELARPDLSLSELVEWYFREQLGQPTPADIAVCAGQAGFADEDELKRALLREHCYFVLKAAEHECTT
jgi:hypothetical protein